MTTSTPTAPGHSRRWTDRQCHARVHDHGPRDGRAHALLRPGHDRRADVSSRLDPAQAVGDPTSRQRCKSVLAPPGMRKTPAVASMAGPGGSEKTNDRENPTSAAHTPNTTDRRNAGPSRSVSGKTAEAGMT